MQHLVIMTVVRLNWPLYSVKQFFNNPGPEAILEGKLEQSVCAYGNVEYNPATTLYRVYSVEYSVQCVVCTVSVSHTQN